VNKTAKKVSNSRATSPRAARARRNGGHTIESLNANLRAERILEFAEMLKKQNGGGDLVVLPFSNQEIAALQLCALHSEKGDLVAYLRHWAGQAIEMDLGSLVEDMEEMKESLKKGGAR
jgi:hypothetical protein